MTNTILLCEYTTFHLSIHRLEIWIICTCWVLWIPLLWSFRYAFLYGHIFISLLLCIYLGVEEWVLNPFNTSRFCETWIIMSLLIGIEAFGDHCEKGNCLKCQKYSSALRWLVWCCPFIFWCHFVNTEGFYKILLHFTNSDRGQLGNLSALS